MSEQISTPMDPASSMEADIEEMTQGMFEEKSEPAPATTEQSPSPEAPTEPAPETTQQQEPAPPQEGETQPASVEPATPVEPPQEGTQAAAPFLTAGETIYKDQAAAVQGVPHKDTYIGQLRGENDQWKQYSTQAESHMQSLTDENANLKSQLENTTKANEQGRQLTQEEIDQIPVVPLQRCWQAGLVKFKSKLTIGFKRWIRKQRRHKPK